jgi:energy-coupling factor transporter ATP-binding protein EcfA2
MSAVHAIVDHLLAAPARLGGVRVLAIDGPSGAGKSTLAAAVNAVLRERGVAVALVSTDDFATWDDPVAWWPRFAEGVLQPLACGGDGGFHPMDWSGPVPRLGELVRVPVPDVLLIEGVSAGRASFRRSLSHLCWVPGPPAPVRLDRAARRDGEAARPRLAQWQAFERGWFAVDRTERDADSIGLDQLP